MNSGGNIVAVDPKAPDPLVISQAADLLRRGDIVAFPTETVYGLGGNALEESAVRRIFEAKGRPSHNPLIVHVASIEAARALTKGWSESAERLARKFWPGPLTLVLPKAVEVPDLVTAGLPTVGIRVPRHPVTFALLTAVELPVAAPSANRSGEVSPTTAQHVARSLGDRVPLILDAGPTDIGIESTVVDVSGDTAILLRPGVISSEQLAEIVGPLKTLSAASPDAPLPSPGMLDRHYAPRTPLRLFETAQRSAVESEIQRAKAQGKRVGVLAWSKEVNGGDPLIILPASPLAAARILYSVLHRLDDEGCELILVERPPTEPRWAALRDRLERAARP
ncbi:MAG TPA: L-threonylcarbamoyladenylate synthase [Gemmatimonadales bacterium]|nr:L-threonylcarbamoyladenylate synthase [Gemmatimonadales bacterium]